MNNDDKNVGLWVVRRVVPEGSRETPGRWYLSGTGGWHYLVGFARRFGHRDLAVRQIARELKAWPDLWGQVVPVRLVKKSADRCV